MQHIISRFPCGSVKEEKFYTENGSLTKTYYEKGLLEKTINVEGNKITEYCHIYDAEKNQLMVFIKTYLNEDNVMSLHSFNDYPSNVTRYNKTNYETLNWHRKGKPFRENGLPTSQRQSGNIVLYESYSNEDGKHHREIGPAIINYRLEPCAVEKESEIYFINGVNRRLDISQPSRIRYDPGYEILGEKILTYTNEEGTIYKIVNESYKNDDDDELYITEYKND